MRSYPYRVAGDETRISLPETRDDLDAFADWIRAQGRRRIAVDTESTGLQQFYPGHRLRMVQFGTATEAWVLPVEYWPQAWATARHAVALAPRIVMHNAPFDWLELDRHLGVPLEHLARKTVDTRILAHLLDPRGPQDGGIGHGLKALSSHHIDSAAPDTQDGLVAVFRSLGYTKEGGWAVIPTDHPVYVRYAGLDVIFTSRLFDVLEPALHDWGLGRLAAFEHEVARVCATIQRTGFLVDPDYLTELSARLASEAEHHRVRAGRYGVTTVNSTRHVADALTAMGETLTATTATGAMRVDHSVLLPLADLDPSWERIGVREPNPLADAVVRAKRASKWMTTYADAIAAGLDGQNRLHPKINALQARTARMSVSSPPLQQLPAGDSTIRQVLVAEPDHVVASVDYSAIEMRVLAALSGDPAMVRAIRDGVDLHDYTATELFGTSFTQRDRKIAKVIGFGKVYGGGVTSLARQTGSTVADVRRAVAAYDRAFPGVTPYSSRLTARGRYGAKELISPTGRILPLDRTRLYAATNHLVQATARDVFAQGLVDLDARGLTEYIRLPMHDEVVFTAPKDEARNIAEEMQDQMAVPEFFCVPLDTEAEIYGPRWQPDATQWVKTGSGPWRASQPAA